MDKNASKQNMRHVGRIVWIVVLFLLVAIMLTMVLLSPVLVGMSNGERNIIPLMYEGDCEVFDKNGFSYIRVDKAPDFASNSSEEQWQVTADVDLFKSAYANEDGEIVVQSLNGDPLIAPGTSNEYEFSFKNTGNISLDYSMRLDNVFTLLYHDLPMVVRLRCGDRWILGGEDSWVSYKKISDVSEKGTISVNEYVTYTFEWKWPLENEADGDTNDTDIVEYAPYQDVSFKLSIDTQCEMTPGAVPMDGNGNELANPLVLWNILSRIILPAAIVVGIVILLLTLFFSPIYVTGFVPDMPGCEFNLGKKKSIIRPDGRFVFKKVYFGKHRFILGQKECPVRLKRSSKVEGVYFEVKDGVLEITVNSKVRAIELYMITGKFKLAVDRSKWAVIDKKRNVITPQGIKAPEDDNNVTPGGLHISKEGYFEI